MPPVTESVPITQEHALAIAHADAIQAYGEDMSRFRIEVRQDGSEWYIDYRFVPAARFQTGGGPHYIINAHTGDIVSKRYEQ